jgi:hypothetical protein
MYEHSNHFDKDCIECIEKETWGSNFAVDTKQKNSNRERGRSFRSFRFRGAIGVGWV